jgi:hypothetical protein
MAETVQVGDVWEWWNTTIVKEFGTRVEITRADPGAIDAVVLPERMLTRSWGRAEIVTENWKLVSRKTVAEPPFDYNKYPHKCPRCSQPAYRGAFQVDCSSSACPTKRD